jgi:mono/diheme cytochrome c family protein
MKKREIAMTHWFKAGSAALLSLLLPISTPAADKADSPAAKSRASAKDIQRGRYLVKIGGCNDCHTPGYMQSAGKVPENQWLTGAPLGWRGPWGTTYAVNLRLYMQDLSEQQWMAIAKKKEMRPPMPWFVLRDMSDADLRAIYRYIRHLGPAGQPAAAYLPPGQEPKPPFVTFPQ